MAAKKQNSKGSSAKPRQPAAEKPKVEAQVAAQREAEVAEKQKAEVEAAARREAEAAEKQKAEAEAAAQREAEAAEKQKAEVEAAARRETEAAEKQKAEVEAAARRESEGKRDGTDGADIEGIWVRSIPKSFRRAGIQFNKHGVGIALDAITPEQLEALESEPNLVVEHVTFTDDSLRRP